MSLAPCTSIPAAVIDDPSGRMCFWHCDVGPDIGLPRPSRAWVLEPDDTSTIVTLIPGRHVALYNDTDILARENITTARTVNIGATADAVITVREASTLVQPHTRHQCTPTWPEVSHPKDIAATVSGREDHRADR